MTEQKNNLDNQERIVVQENAYTPEDIEKNKTMDLEGKQSRSLLSASLPF